MNNPEPTPADAGGNSERVDSPAAGLELPTDECPTVPGTDTVRCSSGSLSGAGCGVGLLITGNGTQRSYLSVVGLLTVGATLWFGLNQSGPYGPLVLGWITPPAAPPAE